MGEVYLAKHPRLPRQDALKVLPTAISTDFGFRTRFEREADLAATLWHPHIVGVHDRGEFEGRLWIAMDYVEGSDASKLLREQFPHGMPARDVAEIVVAVAEALDYAHEQQLLHRDVKPANILLTDTAKARRRILLADFGIARHTDDVTGLTATNMTVGSVNYTAPEQLTGEHIDGRADQYALAATAFHLLTGTPPFPHTNPAVVISRHLGTPPPALADTHPTLAALDAALAKALAKNPTERYDTCTDFATALTTPSTHTAATDPPITAAGGARTPADPPPPADPPTTLLSTPPTTMITPAATTPASTPIERPPIVVSPWGKPDEPPVHAESEDAERLVNVQGGAPPSTGGSPATGLLVGIGVAVVVLLIGAIALNAAGTKTSNHSSFTTDASPATTSSSAPAATTSHPTFTAAPPTTSREVYPPGHHVTIADYIQAGGIIETPIKRGDPGSPTIDLPIPAGWEDAGAKTPSYAWGAIVSTDPTFAADPPSVVALMSKLTGAAEATSVIEYAPGELKNLPGFEGGDGDKSTLSGFDAYQLGGSYMKDGVKRMIAQKTVVIPGRDGGLYVLQLNADGLENQMTALMDATTEIDEESVITP